MPQTERKTLSQSNMVFHVKKRVRNQGAVYDATILVSVHSEEAEKKNGKFNRLMVRDVSVKEGTTILDAAKVHW